MAAAAQDAAAQIPSAPFEGIDTVVVVSPLPGGISTVVRILFNLPQWFQIAGFIAGVCVAAVVLVYLWRRRRTIAGWVATRERQVQWALGLTLLVLIAVGGSAGAYGWNYMQHDNGFCTGCHVMDPAFQEFVGFESKHATLSCHACHQQSMMANLRQLYLWVAERPEEIGPHAPVPDRVCKSCHGVGDPTDTTWRRIAETAGHRVHLESDSVALRDVMCVTCHGLEVHRFVPANRTCAQQGCHEESQTEIVLGRMAGQTFRHCSQCHRFTADVPALAMLDSARRTLLPVRQQCLACHEMVTALGDDDFRRDPHAGQCGLCHNPHTQAEVIEAVATCASAGCHANWRDIPFHVGRAHRATATECLLCHEPHAARVDASDCEGCHTEVRTRGRYRAPLPFDTAAALRRITVAPHVEPPLGVAPPPARSPGNGGGLPLRGKGDVPPEDEPPSGVPVPAPLKARVETRDTFRHDRHRDLACVTCHRSSVRHGELTFEVPRGCQICHHQAPLPSRCEPSHQLEPLREARYSVAFSIAVAAEPPRLRTVPFSHERHQALTCVSCHTTPVSLALSSERAQCRGCHDAHHDPIRDCAFCHSTPALRVVHERELGGRENASHQRCDACHTPASVALLEPRRSFCSTCHPDQRSGHYEGRECSLCHLLTTPTAWRPRLFQRGGPP
jgi:nitrate/TMAO reductase-like tetraheme cytochrome c subunit